jgi:hypothetical protein
MSKWTEIRNDFYDEEENCWCIDAWKTPDDNEEGSVIAKVYDNGEVVYLDEDAKVDYLAQEVIQETLEMVEKER